MTEPGHAPSTSPQGGLPDDPDTVSLSDLGRALYLLERHHGTTSFRVAEGPVAGVDETLRVRWAAAWETYVRRGRSVTYR